MNGNDKGWLFFDAAFTSRQVSSLQQFSASISTIFHSQFWEHASKNIEKSWSLEICDQVNSNVSVLRFLFPEPFWSSEGSSESFIHWLIGPVFFKPGVSLVRSHQRAGCRSDVCEMQCHHWASLVSLSETCIHSIFTWTITWHRSIDDLSLDWCQSPLLRANTRRGTKPSTTWKNVLQMFCAVDYSQILWSITKSIKWSIRVAQEGKLLRNTFPTTQLLLAASYLFC